jgi:DNA mismatch endonuclease, patch repair protein
VTDTLSRIRRSENMRRIKSKNTKPEMRVRRFLCRNGIRYRLHAPGVVGKPDIVISKHRIAIFVHGCFWHHHSQCKRATMPKTNIEYWSTKFKKTQDRDRSAELTLRDDGWQVIVIWECETTDDTTLTTKLFPLCELGR